MKIEITTTKRVKKIIDVEFPYYYMQDLTDYEYEDTCVIYGKKTETEDITIREKIRSNHDKNYEVEKEPRNDSYFDDEYKSNVEEFENAKARALAFLNEC